MLLFFFLPLALPLLVSDDIPSDFILSPFMLSPFMPSDFMLSSVMVLPFMVWVFFPVFFVGAAALVSAPMSLLALVDDLADFFFFVVVVPVSEPMEPCATADMVNITHMASANSKTFFIFVSPGAAEPLIF